MYGTPFAITASGNSQPVASTPSPETDPTLENPPAETFLSAMVSKFSATPSTVEAVKLQSEIVKQATEFGLLPAVTPIRKAASESMPLQLLTLTESMLNLLGLPLVRANYGAYAFVVPALRKLREGRGTPTVCALTAKPKPATRQAPLLG